MAAKLKFTRDNHLEILQWQHNKENFIYEVKHKNNDSESFIIKLLTVRSQNQNVCEPRNLYHKHNGKISGITQVC